MLPASYSMKPTYRGDHWEGINSIEIGFSGGIPEALVSGRMQFRKDKKRGGIADYEINTASSGIIIDDSGSNGTGWALSIPQQA